MVKIICEGDDDKSFLTQLLNHLKQENLIKFEDSFQSVIEHKQGKTNLLNKDKYASLTTQINSSKISKVLFVFDSDFYEDNNQCNNLENSKKCIEELIEQLKWRIKPEYYIFDKNLDYFIIETLEKKGNFLQCEECFDLKKLNKNRKILTCIYQNLYPSR